MSDLNDALREFEYVLDSGYNYGVNYINTRFSEYDYNFMDYNRNQIEFLEDTIGKTNSINSRVLGNYEVNLNKYKDNPEFGKFKEIYDKYVQKWNTYSSENLPDLKAMQNQRLGLQNQNKYGYGSRKHDILLKMNRRVQSDIKEQVSELNYAVDKKLWESGYESQYGYDEFNKEYTRNVHPNVYKDNSYNKLYDFFSDDTVNKYNEIKKAYPDLILNSKTINYEFDIDKAHKEALRHEDHLNWRKHGRDRDIRMHKSRRDRDAEHRKWLYENKYLPDKQRMAWSIENDEQRINNLIAALKDKGEKDEKIANDSYINKLKKELEEKKQEYKQTYEIEPTRKRRAGRRNPNNDNILESIVEQTRNGSINKRTPWREKDRKERQRQEQNRRKEIQQQDVVDSYEWDIDTGNTMPTGIEDLHPETLANLTNEEIIEWAQNGEDYEKITNLRSQARKDLGMDDVPEIETTGRNTEMETPLNNNFNGGVPNTTPDYSKFESFKNPGRQTSRVFGYDGRDYALLEDLKIDVNNLDKGFTGGVLVDLADGKAYGPDYVLNKINSKLTSGDIDGAMEELNKITEAEHTLPRNEVEKLMVDRYNAETNQPEPEIEPEIETSSGDGGNQEPPKTNTSTDIPDPDDTPKTRSRKQRIEDAGKRLGNNKGPNGSRKRFTGQRVANNSKRSIKKRKLSGNKFKVKKGNLKEVIANTVVSKVVGEATETVEKTVQRLNPNLLNGLDDFADLTDDDIAYFADQISDRKQRKASIEKWERNRERAKKERKNKQIIDDFENGKFDYDPENPYGNRIRHNLNEKLAEEVAEETLGSNKVDDVFGWMKKHKIGVLDVGFNLFSSIGDYKDSRRKGHGVVSSAARAVGSFAVGEMLGFWGGMGVTAFKLAGTGIVKGTELLYKENRRMNSAANNSAFGAAEFQDTQQLATMRQSGMEMAKMAQYNLQQTLMGNEATYLHR